ncbi:hypothetical protein U9M48_040265 [Paspalum notatum var. saurae]|uniref:indole-3-glycerol-phosphate synthase n=1 Tax=Paspalum notatum var. saurae TaxID=547442 RepID=A0AAQ3ULQ8_PASNO
MDFIEGLPRVHGKSVILTVVDRFSKYTHFIALGHPYTATSVVRAFFNEIVRLHRLPASIVSDCNPVFTSAPWRDLFKMSGIKLRMSTAFHPQTDGQSEVTNRTIAMYLRCITGDRPRAWVDWLPWAEYCYYTAYHTALRATPFQVVYGREPPPLGTYRDGSARRRWTTCCAIVISSLARFAIGFFRRRRTPSASMTARTALWSSRWMIGSGFACYIVRRPPWCAVPMPSSGHATRGHFRSVSGSERWPTASSYRRAFASTSSMWGSSSPFMGLHQWSHRHYLPWSMVACCLYRPGSCILNCAGHAMKPLNEVIQSAEKAPPSRDFYGALEAAYKRNGMPALIAELKKASPSRGVLRENFNPVEIAQTYEKNGAACLSILTDEKYFQGSFENLEKVRTSGVKCPLLCKEFVIDKWQIYNARSKGADAVLLIAAVLPDLGIKCFLQICKDLGMTALIEVHDEREMERVLNINGVKLIGINNRSLETFVVDTSNTKMLLEKHGDSIREKGILVVGESGLFSPDDVAYVQKAGISAVLVGESLVKQEDPGRAIAGLFGKELLH